MFIFWRLTNIVITYKVNLSVSCYKIFCCVFQTWREYLRLTLSSPKPTRTGSRLSHISTWQRRWGRMNKDPHILYFGTRLKCVLSFTFYPLLPRRRNASTHSTGDRLVKRKTPVTPAVNRTAAIHFSNGSLHSLRNHDWFSGVCVCNLFKS